MLFKKHTLGNIELQNRIVMPPMTRSRAAKGEVATPLMAEYYEQRSSAGLIISEGTQISQQGQGYTWTPGSRSKLYFQSEREIVFGRLKLAPPPGPSR